MTRLTEANIWQGPSHNCAFCPRLVALREDLRVSEPDWHNGPVPSFGELNSRLLVVGLAPGMNGANRTGRPFTGDYAGDLLYEGLSHFGFAEGKYEKHANDSLKLVDCRIANAVRCLPPKNKPTTDEAKTCRPFLISEIQAMPNLRQILALGRIAHEAVLRALGISLKQASFAHGAAHRLGDITITDSYHCSRYNTNTGRLTREMFFNVIGEVRQRLDV